MVVSYFIDIHTCVPFMFIFIFLDTHGNPGSKRNSPWIKFVNKKPMDQIHGDQTFGD